MMLSFTPVRFRRLWWICRLQKHWLHHIAADGLMFNPPVSCSTKILHEARNLCRKTLWCGRKCWAKDRFLFNHHEFRMIFSVYISRLVALCCLFPWTKQELCVSVPTEDNLIYLYVFNVVLMHLYICIIQKKRKKKNLTLPRLAVRIITLLMHSICLHTKRSGRRNQPIGNLSN